MTKEQRKFKEEIAKCMHDIVYFVEKYIVVMTDNGAQRVKLRDYQKQIIRDATYGKESK